MDWRAALGAMRPGPRVRRGSALAVAGVLGALYLYSGWQKIAGPAPNWAGVPALLLLLSVPALAAAAVLVAGGAVWRRLRIARRGDVALLAVALALPFALGFLLERDGVPRRTGIAAMAFAALMAAAAGAGLAALTARPRPASWRFGVALAGLVLGALGLSLFAGWLAWDGPAAAPLAAIPAGSAAGATVGARSAAGAGSSPVDALQDPTTPGPFRARTLTYGSGADRHRPEYGEKADLKTSPVDGRPFVRRWSGLAGWARTRYWGFDASALPLQARVTLPEGAGPFPVVMVVHGNHVAEEPSDTGYAYLGDLLASRGYVFVSVDESFLNESLADVTSGHTEALVGENAARAWLLLQHLSVLRAWNGEKGNVLQGKLDMERVALVGHSRGGEAVLVAAAFNRLPAFPDDPAIRFDFGFGIRAVIGLAPVDGQYEPGGKSAAPEGVSYLVLQGSLDADVGSFVGARAYARVRVEGVDGAFKAGVFFDRGSHAQFNTVWGRPDLGGLAGRFVATAALLSEQDQRRIAAVHVSAFLDAVLLGKRAYRALFRGDRAGAAWLPDVPLRRQYEDSGIRRVATFDEDTDPSTATLAGAKVSAVALDDWHEEEVPMKAGPLGTRAVWLAWSAHVATESGLGPSFIVRLPADSVVAARSALSFHLADARGAEGNPVDLTIEITDRAGLTARVPLGRAGLLPPLSVRSVWKPPARAQSRLRDTVFEYFEVPLSAFVEVAPALDAAHPAAVRLVFDRAPSGAVILDDLGFREEPPGD